VSTWESPAAAQPSIGDPAAGASAQTPASLDALMDVSMPVVIEIGRASLTVQEVLQLGAGSVIQLDRIVGEPVDIYVSDRKLAQGEVVVVGEYFGVRITRVLSGQTVEAAA
jgi:flagellar motor switch protein FliN/FliY